MTSNFIKPLKFFLSSLLILPYLLIPSSNIASDFDRQLLPLILVLLLSLYYWTFKFLIHHHYTRLKSSFIKITIITLSLILILLIQIPLQKHTYASLNLFTIVFILGVALTYCTLTDAQQYIKKNQLIQSIAIAIIIGSFIQHACMLVQLFQIPNMGQWIYFTNTSDIFGNIGQRNLLAHYLLWGIASTTYLIAIKKIHIQVGLILLSWQAFMLGLIPSRTIILIILSVTIITILYALNNPIFKAKKYLPLFSISLLLIILFQIYTPVIFSYFDFNFNSSIDRAAHGSYLDRIIEWKKALQITWNAPWMGHGWDSYAWNSFNIDADPEYSNRNRSASNIFTHSHNMILNLTAELGIPATIFILISLTWIILKHLKNISIEKCFLLSLITITLTHSLVEFPLWYGYFFIPFTIFIALLCDSSESQSTYSINITASIVLTTALLLISCAIIYSQLLTLRELYNFSTTKNDREAAERLQEIEQYGEKHFMIQPYADSRLLYSLDVNKEIIPNWGFKVAERYPTYRPYLVPMFIKIRLDYLNGKKQQALIDLNTLAIHYPKEIPFMLERTSQNSKFKELHQFLIPYCLQAQKQYKLNENACNPSIQTVK